MQESDGWQRVAALADLADDAALAVKLGNRRIALYRLDGKVAIVTGAARGIGAEFAATAAR